MLDLTGTAGEYLTPPARRPDWQDTWTMQRTRRHAMAGLSAAYAGARRTLTGALATVLLLAGAYLIGLGADGVGGADQLAATGILAGGVLVLLVGLGLAGYVLFTGVRVVKSLRAWSKVRDLDGGPGVSGVLSLSLLLRLLLAVLILAAGVAMALVRLELFTPEILTDAGDRGAGRMLWQWSAAAIGILAGLAALAGFVLSAVALRRPRPHKGAGEVQSAPHAPQAGARGADPGAQAAPSSAPAWPQASSETAAQPYAHPMPGYPGQPMPGAPAQPASPVPAQPLAPAQPGSPVDDVADTRLAADVPRPAAAAPRIAAVLPDGGRITAPGVTLLGRSPAARADEHVAGTGVIDHASVSKTHLSIRIDGEAIWATDRASTNGTDLFRSGDQYSLVAWEEAPLYAGDELVLGAASVRIESA